jgi:sulfide:quinone oxidoreductase
MQAAPAAATLSDMQDSPLNVVIVGGGVAALEALIALHNLAEERVQLQLLTPQARFAYRPLAVAEPFGLGEPPSYDLHRIAEEHGAALHLGELVAVDPDAHAIHTRDGGSLGYDVLLLAVGARPTVSIPGSVTIKGPGYTSRFRTVLRDLEERRIRRVVFAVPSGASWPLPLYELALMTAARVAERGLRKVELSVVTPESEPLELFGPTASASLRDLLDDRGVQLHTARYPADFREGELTLVPSGSLPAERVVSLPRLRGPEIAGLPSDPEGFIHVDLHGLVQGQPDIYAAGDATTCPIKQGGVAAQQADAAAEAIAARAGADVDPREFRPVLRGMLLTGSTPRYMRAEVSGGQGEAWDLSEHALWWPPSKIAGRWLAPYLAVREKGLEGAPAGLPVEVSVGSPRGAAGATV